MKYYQQVLSSLKENGNIPSLNSLQSNFPSPEILLNKYKYLYLIYNKTYRLIIQIIYYININIIMHSLQNILQI